MSEIGELVQETIDFASRDLPARAFLPACLAYQATQKKALGSDDISELDQKKFIAENWWLIRFMGLSRALPLPESVFNEAINLIPGFDKTKKAEDLFLFLLRQNIVSKALPIGFDFNKYNSFEASEGEVLLPISAPYAFLGVAIFHPINKDETIPENYWINFGNFRTFVSELWGRVDLVERAVKLS